MNLINFKKILKIFSILLTSAILLVMIIVTAALIFLSKKINQPVSYLLNTPYQTLKNNEFKNQKSINFLILGLDKRDDRLEKTETTDTIMIAFLNLNNGQIKITSIPRDLWDYQLNTKINNIYPLSLSNKQPFDFLQTNFSRLTGIPIEKTIIFTTQNLIDFVEIIGGVDVFLDKVFMDNKYPNPEYITNPKAPIYKTISFDAGWNHLSESNITEFVRSRKSAETAIGGGTDIGRIERQQSLIDAIIKKIKTKEFIIDYSNLIKLYNFWHNQINTNLTDKNLTSIGIILQKQIKNISLTKIELTIGSNEKEGQIYHPENFINKQWVFIPADKEYKNFHQFFQSNFLLY
ncbi:MAG: LCP family protein [Candidatus Shapirobacteria bacterium]|nr:LCP family protein [Candidatus Shapirobacteria bacterium]